MSPLYEDLADVEDLFDLEDVEALESRRVFDAIRLDYPRRPGRVR